jgi:TolB protein
VTVRVPRTTWMVILLFVAAPATAQRRTPVLGQVRVPHSYYWREMFVPQVTSGPSGAAWSPDGRELIYSMQGSLWRQLVGTTVARQVTGGEGYDFQPDWSPDGRSVVYASYDGREMALKLLDIPTGASRTILANGAVNVEPRWSPDGTRIAFVSSAFEGRWHIFVAGYANARLDSAVRITEDRDSGLPRQYYGAFDQYLSPTWSPDGRELIYVSNRGRIHGSGGLWRMEARRGGGAREIHYEETSWKARPDWSRGGGGARLVYSSYLGRQWNQLWLTRPEGGDPVQLTYGDFDATVPRWSPDGSRIAYVSNEGGNTSLWTLSLPGGKRERVVARTRAHLRPMGRLMVTIVDSVTRRPVAARVSVRHADGRFSVPDNAWRHAVDAIARDAAPFEYAYWHSRGSDTLLVPPGRYTVQSWRGPEYQVVTRTVEVRADVVTNARLTVAPLLAGRASLRAQGWWSGDAHVHMNYGGAYRNTPATLAHQARAEGVSLVHNLVVNKEQRIPDIAYWSPGLLHAAPDVLIANGQELHTGLWGHAALLGLREHFVLPDYAGYPNTPLASLYPTNAVLFDVARGQGAITGYVHPLDAAPELSEIVPGIPYELPVDVATNRVDFLEVMGFSDHRATSDVWYKLLNCGFRIPAVAGTDAFANFASSHAPVGTLRTYARSGATLDARRWLTAVKAGRTFVTNGPLIAFSLDNRDPGAELRFPFGGTHLVRARVSVRSNLPVDQIEIVSNGRVVSRFGGRVRDTSLVFRVTTNSWFLARASTNGPRAPVPADYLFASTSPIYVTVGNAPPSCREEAEYFLRWINVLSQRLRADSSWNTPSERERTLALISRAHEEFIRRR